MYFCLSWSPSLAADGHGAWVGLINCLAARNLVIKLSPLSVAFPQRRPLNSIEIPQFIINHPCVQLINNPFFAIHQVFALSRLSPKPRVSKCMILKMASFPSFEKLAFWYSFCLGVSLAAPRGVSKRKGFKMASFLRFSAISLRQNLPPHLGRPEFSHGLRPWLEPRWKAFFHQKREIGLVWVFGLRHGDPKG